MCTGALNRGPLRSRSGDVSLPRVLNDVKPAFFVTDAGTKLCLRARKA